MHPQARRFIGRYLGVVIAALVPVVLTAFLSIPFNLQGHPGEARTAQASAGRHMT